MKTHQITATTLANIVPLAVTIAAAMLSQPLFAQEPAHNLEITENSSTSLSAAFDGSAVTVLNTAPDRWTLTFPDTFTFGVFTINGWNEPESGLGNILDSTGTNQLFVLSDIGLGSEGFPDGTTIPGELLVISGNLTGVNITFHDNAATAEAGVPDTGSTLGLLLLSSIGLLGATRFQRT